MSGASLTIPAGGGIAKLRFTVAGIGDELVCSFGFLLPDWGESSHTPNNEPATAAGSISDAFTAAWPAGGLHQSAHFYGVDVAIWDEGQVAGGTPHPPLTGSHLGGFAGSGTFTPLPANNAVLVHKLTARSGKIYRGRIYLPGVCQSAPETGANGALSEASRNGVTTRMQDFRENLLDSDVNIVPHLFHGQRKSHGVVIGPGAPPTAITAFECDGIIGSQRRRLHRS
jgi:hypothetical protein